jgi:hypothetical protein
MRNKRLDIKLSLEERKAIEDMAEKEGRNFSEMSRELLREGIAIRINHIPLKEFVNQERKI